MSNDGDDSAYEYFMLTDYVKGRIDEIEEDSKKNTVTVYFDDYDDEISNGMLVLDYDDVHKLYKFINENNERCDAACSSGSI